MGPVIHISSDNGLSFMCPGCNTEHRIQYGEGAGPRWTYNGDAEHPTLHPSILVRTGHYAHGRANADECWCTYYKEHPEDTDRQFKCYTCHSFVTQGRIQFLSDCTHELAGQTVDLPAWP
jgi:Family of unknown function (DUF6527)